MDVLKRRVPRPSAAPPCRRALHQTPKRRHRIRAPSGSERGTNAWSGAPRSVHDRPPIRALSPSAGSGVRMANVEQQILNSGSPPKKLLRIGGNARCLCATNQRAGGEALFAIRLTSIMDRRIRTCRRHRMIFLAPRFNAGFQRPFRRPSPNGTADGFVCVEFGGELRAFLSRKFHRISRAVVSRPVGTREPLGRQVPRLERRG